MADDDPIVRLLLYIDNTVDVRLAANNVVNACLITDYDTSIVNPTDPTTDQDLIWLFNPTPQQLADARANPHKHLYILAHTWSGPYDINTETIVVSELSLYALSTLYAHGMMRDTVKGFNQIDPLAIKVRNNMPNPTRTNQNLILLNDYLQGTNEYLSSTYLGFSISRNFEIIGPLYYFQYDTGINEGEYLSNFVAYLLSLQTPDNVVVQGRPFVQYITDLPPYLIKWTVDTLFVRTVSPDTTITQAIVKDPSGLTYTTSEYVGGQYILELIV